MYKQPIKTVWILILIFCIVTIFSYLFYLHDETIVIIKEYKAFAENKYIKHKELIIKSNKMKIVTSSKLLPQGINDTTDRISEQLMLTKTSHPRKPKIILQYPYIFKEKETYFIDNNCHINDCILSSNWSMLFDDKVKVDAVTLSDQALEDIMPPKLPGQIWILRMLECPFYTYPLKKVSNKINWTATYRFDSTISTPYFKYMPYKIPIIANHLDINYAEGKTKIIAWFVSNCADKSGRMQYVNELQKYIKVDIYGACGTLKCARENKECDQRIGHTYKFYLAFENSKCRHYITEKPYEHALR